MTPSRPSAASYLAGSMEAGNRYTLREILTKIFIRSRLFVVCVLLTTLSALFCTWLVPPSYQAKAKILIRYDSVESPFFSEISAPQKQIISGQSNAEMIKSLPVSQRVVEQVQVSDRDIARPAYKVLFAYGAKPLSWFLGDRVTEAAADPHQKNLRIAEDLEKTIDVKIVQKNSPVLQINDELLEVSVKSTNRDKVAEIANSYYQNFVDEYYRLSEQEARRAKDFLEVKYRDLLAILNGKGPQDHQQLASEFSAYGDRSVSKNTVVDDLTRQVSELEILVNKLEYVYKEDSTELLKAKNDLAKVRGLLDQQLTKESGKALLRVYKDKLRQVGVSLQIYENRLIPISLIEPAVTPKQSMLAVALRYGLNGGLGLFAGLALAFALVLFLGGVDQNLNTDWDVSRQIGLPVLASLPAIKGYPGVSADRERMPPQEGFHSFLSILGRLGTLEPLPCRVVAVTGVTQAEGTTFLALNLAATLAHDRETKALLIDGNLERPDLSECFAAGQSPGLMEVLRGELAVRDGIRPTHLDNLSLLPAGQARDRRSLGYFRKSLLALLDEVRNDYDMVFFDAPGVLNSTDAMIFAAAADTVLMVVKSGSTKREPLRKSLAILAQNGAGAFEIVLNFRRFPIPRFLYRIG